MMYEIATLYSGFARWRAIIRFANRHGEPEGSRRINRVFRDVFRHFPKGTVAKRRQSSVGVAASMAVLLAGCAAGPGSVGLSADAPAEVKRDAVAARAKARWDALIKLDLTSAYAFLSPASRATMPLDLYKAKHKLGMYREIRIDDVQCEADTCTVKLSLTYDYQRFKGIKTPLVEKWIITQGQAWFVDRG